MGAIHWISNDQRRNDQRRNEETKKMDLQGKQLIAGEFTAQGADRFQAIDASMNAPFGTQYYEATHQEVRSAAAQAQAAFEGLRTASVEVRVKLLELIAEEIMNLGEELLNIAHRETGLPMGRLNGERGRMVNQIGLFAGV